MEIEINVFINHRKSTKIMKAIFVLITTFTLLQLSKAQTSDIDHYSINLGGGSAGLADYSVGQTAIATLYSGDAIITQGFQQPEIGIGTQVQDPQVLQASVAPNPILDFSTLDIEFAIAHSGLIQLVSIEGKVIFAEDFDRTTSIHKDLNLRYIAPGMYILQVYDLSGKILYIHKLIKQ